MAVDHRTMFYVLRYLGRITKEEVTFKFGKHEKHYTPPEKVEISPNFFQSSVCRRCGSCCHAGISMVATVSDVDRIQENIYACGHRNYAFLPQDLKILKPTGNYTARWYVSPKMARDEQCPYLFHEGDEKLPGCQIQSYKSVNCWIPLLYIARNSNSVKGVLTKRMHGKLWVPGCTSRFETFDYEEFLRDIIVLERLQLTAEDLELKTWLPEIIHWCHEQKNYLMAGWFPQSAIQILKPKSKVNQLF